MRKVLLLSTILLAGCAARPPAAPPRPRPVPVAAPAPSGLSPANYLATSASRSLLLVRASELAGARVPEVAIEANRVAADHRGIAAQLNLAGRRLDLLPSAELLPADRLQLDSLGRSADVATACAGSSRPVSPAATRTRPPTPSAAPAPPSDRLPALPSASAVRSWREGADTRLTSCPIDSRV